MPTEELLVPIVALVLAIYIAMRLYNPAASTTLASAFGLVRNAFLAFAGLMLLISNTMVGLFAGMFLVGVAVYLGRGHYDRLPNNDLRKKING